MIPNVINRLVSLPIFNRTESQQSSWNVIAWWESRRVFYNLIVGSTGVFTTVVCFVSALIGEHYIGIPIGLPDPPLLVILGIATYAIMANVCYTGGWIAELIARQFLGPQAAHFGKIAFFLGLCFSVLLTLVPSGIVVGTLLIQLIIKRTT